MFYYAMIHFTGVYYPVAGRNIPARNATEAVNFYLKEEPDFINQDFDDLIKIRIVNFGIYEPEMWDLEFGNYEAEEIADGLWNIQLPLYFTVEFYIEEENFEYLDYISETALEHELQKSEIQVKYKGEIMFLEDLFIDEIEVGEE